MKQKGAIFINTFLLLIYVGITTLSTMQGAFALLTILVFTLGILSQVILAGIFRPAKITIGYILAVLIRLIAFVTIPIQNSTYITITSIAVTFGLDFWQFLFGKVHEKLESGTVSEEEKKQAALFYKTILIAGLLAYLLFIKSYIVVIFFLIALAQLIRSINIKRVRNRCWIEALLIIIIRMSSEFFAFSSTQLIIIAATSIIVMTQKYYIIYPKDVNSISCRTTKKF